MKSRTARSRFSSRPRWFAWAWRERPHAVAEQAAHGWSAWLLARRSVEDPTDLAYDLVVAPRAGAMLAEVAPVAGSRQHIEVCFATGYPRGEKDSGLGDHEVRTWDAWRRHITLLLLAHAFVVIMRTQSLQKG